MAQKQELWLKLNSLVNRYGGDEGFVANIHQWPRTIRNLVFNSEKLMFRFGLAEPVREPAEIGEGI